MVFVDHYAYAAAALIFKAANHAALVINLHIATRTHNISRKKDRELHQRTNGNIAIHGEEHAVGRDVLRLGGTGSVLRTNGYRQMQRKARCALHFGIVLDRSLL